MRGLPLTFSSSAPAQRNQSDDLPLARGAQVQALPSSCIELWPALRLILITPASVRRTCIFAPSTCAIDRLSKCRLQAYRKCPSDVWVQFYLYRGIAQKRAFEQKIGSNPTFFGLVNSRSLNTVNECPALCQRRFDHNVLLLWGVAVAKLQTSQRPFWYWDLARRRRNAPNKTLR